MSTIGRQTKEVMGTKLEIIVDENFGLSTEINNERLYGETWAQIYPKIQRALKVAKIEHNIPVVIDNPKHTRWTTDATTPHYVRAILRGQNSRTNEYLVTIDGAKDSIKYLKIVEHGKKITDAQLVELNRLAAIAQVANQAADHYKEKIIRKGNGETQAYRLISDAEKTALGEKSS